MRGHDHIHKRLNKYNVSRMFLHCLNMLGTNNGNSYTLSKNDCQRIVDFAEYLKRTFNKMGETGGYILVKDKISNTAITTYRLDSYCRKLARVKTLCPVI